MKNIAMLQQVLKKLSKSKIMKRNIRQINGIKNNSYFKFKKLSSRVESKFSKDIHQKLDSVKFCFSNRRRFS